MIKNKKIIILTFIFFLFTGCTVNYDLKITDNVITEKITINEKRKSFNESTADQNIKNSYSQYNKDGIKKYRTSKIDKGDSIDYVLSQTYFLDNVSYIRAFSECFDAYNIVYTDSTKSAYLLQTSKGFKCMNYEYVNVNSYTINIEINHKVINNNADKVNGNVYTWYINNNNAKEKFISIEFKKNENKITEKEEKPINFMIIILIVGIIIGIAIIAAIYALNLNKKRNKL